MLWIDTKYPCADANIVNILITFFFCPILLKDDACNNQQEAGYGSQVNFFMQEKMNEYQGDKWGTINQV